MTNLKTTERRSSLSFRGRMLDAVEVTGAVLILYFITVTAAAGVLESLGVNAADALRWATAVLPGLVGIVMAARFLEAALRGALAAILAVSGSILRLRGEDK